MRILVSNDDGIDAPGLAALAGAVGDMGEVTVVAPASPQSAAGHAITLHHPLTVKQVELPGLAGKAYSVDGRPADCVRLAIKNILPKPPDLVISGINAGANVGINVFYSGTVAAAAEAVMCGIPAVAMSLQIRGETADFARAAQLCRWVLPQLPITPGKVELFNVNIPVLEPGWPVGVRVAPQSTAGIEDIYHEDADSNGLPTYRLGKKIGFLGPTEGTDIEALAAGYVTVTPLRVDLTDHQYLPRLSSIDWSDPPEPTCD